MFCLFVSDLQHGRVHQDLAQKRHHWQGKVKGGKMINTEKRFRSPWSAPGKNTVDDRNYVATAHQDRHGIEKWLTVAIGCSHISSMCLFSSQQNGFRPLPAPFPTTCTLRTRNALLTHHPGQLPTLFVHNFLPSALSAVYLFLRNDFLTKLLTS